MIIVILVLLGLCFGSFVNAFVWRLYEQSLPKKKRKASDKDLSITTGRSMCTHCGHTLKTIDLLPVISWLSLQGKCRYCKKSISWQYPAVEVSTALLFVASYLYWPQPFDASGTLLLVVWLINLIGLMALLVYDIRWMLLPNKIILPLCIFSSLAVVFDALLFSHSFERIISSVMGVLIGGGIFYVLFQVSGGKWIGGGDVKLGFLLGLLVGGPLPALLVLFLASLIGTIVLLPFMVTKKITSKTRIPFGPLLIAAAIISRLFSQDLLDAYKAHRWHLKNKR